MEKSIAVKHPERPRFTLRQILEGLEGAAIIAAGYLTLFLKPLRDRWGLSREEARMPLPGDELVPDPNIHFTHAIEIDAPPEAVWPWIAQMGQGRGGFYSYEALENVAGLQIYNADEILPQYQHPRLGDKIAFGPNDAYPVVVCEPGRALAIGLWHDLDTKTSYDQPPPRPLTNGFQLTWLWFVEPLPGGRSRFISRNRIRITAGRWKTLMFGTLFEPVVFAMDRKMCLGIKRRAEG